MKTQHTHNKRDYKYKGFTLVETAIAMGMVAVMISSFLVVFGPAIKGIDKSLSAKEADRLTSALELELSVVRNGEDVDETTAASPDRFETPFEKAFWWMRDSARTDGDRHAVLIYKYRGNPDSVRSDGTLNPYPYNATNPGIPGVDYVIQTSVRRLKDTFHTTKIQAELAPGVLEGKVYYVKITQLRYDANGVMVDTTDPGIVTNLYPAHDEKDTPTDYTDDAVLPFKAIFYEAKPPLWSVVGASNYNPASTLTKPVITKNMAVTR